VEQIFFVEQANNGGFCRKMSNRQDDAVLIRDAELRQHVLKRILIMGKGWAMLALTTNGRVTRNAFR
jgi:hypothetical protein